MGQALYRKYRPTSFSDAVGQEHITKTLTRAIEKGKISHAYLFTGPRGIGKTSIARILAHEVNKLPYKDDSIHLDIIEIDAASNRRIDEIRELRDKVHIAPTSAKYKVYIIDEVHMLTREAFNALLKTLEEPPAHCIFILATTEVHKLPDTIISRTQRFSFSPIDDEIATSHLSSIAKKEKISITDSALRLLAQHGKGSFRDSISLLDQLSTAGEKITEETVRDTLGLPAEAAIRQLIDCIQRGDSSSVLENLLMLAEKGTNASAIARELSSKLRDRLIQEDYEEWIPTLLRQLLEVSESTNPRENLEISLLEAASKNAMNNSSEREKKSDDDTTKPGPTGNIKPKNDNESEESSHDTKNNLTSVTASFDIKSWPQIVNYAKKHAASLYTALKLAKPVFSDDTLTLYFQFPLHQKKLNQARSKDLIAQIIEEVSGAKVKVNCEVSKEMFDVTKGKDLARASASEGVKNPIKSISNIFGNAEMLS